LKREIYSINAKKGKKMFIDSRERPMVKKCKLKCPHPNHV